MCRFVAFDTPCDRYFVVSLQGSSTNAKGSELLWLSHNETYFVLSCGVGSHVANQCFRMVISMLHATKTGFILCNPLIFYAKMNKTTYTSRRTN